MDLEDKREVSRDEAKRYAEDNGCLFFETSAKSGENVNAIFTSIAQKLPKNQQPKAEIGIVIAQDDGRSKKCCK